MTHTIVTLHITPPADQSLLWPLVEKVLQDCQLGLKQRYRECEYDHEMSVGTECFKWALLRSDNVPAQMLGVVRSEYARIGYKLTEMGAEVEYRQDSVESAA